MLVTSGVFPRAVLAVSRISNLRKLLTGPLEIVNKEWALIGLGRQMKSRSNPWIFFDSSNVSPIRCWPICVDCGCACTVKLRPTKVQPATALTMLGFRFAPLTRRGLRADTQTVRCLSQGTCIVPNASTITLIRVEDGIHIQEWRIFHRFPPWLQMVAGY